MIQYWLQNDSNTVSLRLDDPKSITLTDGFAVKDYVGEVEMVKEGWSLLLRATEHDEAGRVTQLMGLTERLNHAWRTAVSAIERQEAENMVWLYQRRHGVERRVLIGGGRAVFSRGEWPSAQGNWVVADVEVLRHPCVEDVTPVTVTGTAVNCTGGVLALNKPGNLYAQTTAVSIAPARLADVICSQPSGTGREDLGTVWLGIQPGGTTALNPVYELSTYGIRLDGGAGTTISFATNNQHQLRMRVQISAGGRDVSELRGRWRILMRARTTGGGGLVTTQLASGNTHTGEHIEVATDYINTGGAWQLLEMSEIEIPPEGYTIYKSLGVSSTYGGIGIFLLAGCDNTSMSLEVDRLILIPSRHMVKCSETKIEQRVKRPGDEGNWDDRGLHILTQPDDTQQAVVFNSVVAMLDNFFYSNGIVGMEPINWQLPPEGGVLVVAASRTDDTHDTADTVDVRVKYYARHYTL